VLLLINCREPEQRFVGFDQRGAEGG
jgi:hypothetical protein